MRKCFTRILLFPLLAVALFLFSATITQPIPKDVMERGRKVYEGYCLSCHQPDGSGVPRLNPPLAKTSYVLGDKQRLIRIILHGLEDQIEINGETYSNPMAALDFMQDQEISDVLTYVRNSFGNKASMVTVADVKQARKTEKK